MRAEVEAARLERLGGGERGHDLDRARRPEGVVEGGLVVPEVLVAPAAGFVADAHDQHLAGRGHRDAAVAEDGGELRRVEHGAHGGEARGVRRGAAVAGGRQGYAYLEEDVRLVEAAAGLAAIAGAAVGARGTAGDALALDTVVLDAEGDGLAGAVGAEACAAQRAETAGDG